MFPSFGALDSRDPGIGATAVAGRLIWLGAKELVKCVGKAVQKGITMAIDQHKALKERRNPTPPSYADLVAEEQRQREEAFDRMVAEEEWERAQAASRAALAEMRKMRAARRAELVEEKKRKEAAARTAAEEQRKHELTRARMEAGWI